MRSWFRTIALWSWTVAFGGVLGWPLPQARADTPIIHVHDVKNGFSAQIYNIVQDPNGILWLAQDGGGILAFDGTRSRSFTTREGLPSNALNQILLAKDGKLWVTFSDGPPAWKAHDSFAPWVASPAPDIPGFIGGETLLETQDGGLLFASNVGLLVWKDGQWKPWETPMEKPPVAMRIDYLMQTEAGEIYGIGELGKIWRLAPGDPVLLVDACTESVRPMKLVEDGKGRLLLTGHRGGLMQLLDGRIVPAEPESSHLSDDILPNSLTVLRNGDLLVGTWGQGLLQFHEGSAIRRLSKPHGLPALHIQSVLEDRDGNWLVCTMGGGLAQIVHSPFRNLTVADGLGAPIVWQVEKRPDGTLRVLSHGNILTDFLRDGQVVTRNLSDLGIRANLFGMVHNPDGSMWFYGTGGAFLLDKEWKRIGELSPSSGFPSQRLRKIIREEDGTLLVLTHDIGLVLLAPDGTQTRFDETNGLANQIWAAARRSDGSLVFASDRGPVTFDLKTKTASSLPVSADLNLQVLTDVAVDALGRIWFASGRGAYVYEDGVFRTYTTADGLPHDNIYLALADADGCAWLGTANGLARIDPAGRVHSFGYEDGILNPETNGNSGYRDADGVLYFGTPSGVLILEDPKTGTPAPPPGVVITQFLVNGQLGDGFQHVVRTGEQVFAGELNYSQNNMVIEFLAPSLFNRSAVKYQSRLLGAEEDWSPAGGCEPIHLKNLPAGEYVFQVRACNRENVCNPEPTQLGFHVLAPYWQRTYFRAFIVILSVLAFYLLYRLRVRAEVHRRMELERLVNERTQEIRELSLRDPLTGLRNRRYVVESMLDIGKPSRPFGTDKRQGNYHGMGIFMLDIDHFKRVNDEHGHDSGDMVLTRFSEILTLCLRQEDTVCRWGGEEFLVLTQSNKPHVLKMLAERMRKAVEQADFDIVGGQTIRITCSVGVAPFPFYDMPVEHEPNWEEIKSIADMALYRAKQTGRNKSVLVRAGALLPDNEELTRMMIDLDWSEEMNFFVAEDATGFVPPNLPADTTI